jgi:hypothetical protein
VRGQQEPIALLDFLEYFFQHAKNQSSVAGLQSSVWLAD